MVNVQQSSFSGMILTVGRQVRIKQYAGSEVINEAGYKTERFEIGRQLGSSSLSKVDFLSSGEMTDTLRIELI